MCKLRSQVEFSKSCTFKYECPGILRGACLPAGLGGSGEILSQPVPADRGPNTDSLWSPNSLHHHHRHYTYFLLSHNFKQFLSKFFSNPFFDHLGPGHLCHLLLLLEVQESEEIGDPRVRRDVRLPSKVSVSKGWLQINFLQILLQSYIERLVLNWLCMISRDLLFTLMEMIASSFLYIDWTARSSPSITLKLSSVSIFGKVSTHLIFSNPKDKGGVVINHCPILQLALWRE